MKSSHLKDQYSLLTNLKPLSKLQQQQPSLIPLCRVGYIDHSMPQWYVMNHIYRPTKPMNHYTIVFSFILEFPTFNNKLKNHHERIQMPYTNNQHHTFPKMGYSALNLVQANSSACWLDPGSCFKNWLHGKASISRPEINQQKHSQVNQFQYFI